MVKMTSTSSSDSKRARLEVEASEPAAEPQPAQEPELPVDDRIEEQFKAWQLVTVAWRGDELKVMERHDEFVEIKDVCKPEPPPGPGWQKYTDDGKIWYSYDGALGKWWCEASAVDKIHPYSSDSEDDETQTTLVMGK